MPNVLSRARRSASRRLWNFADNDRVLEGLRKNRLPRMKLGYSHARIIPNATYAPWLDDQDFRRLHSRIRHNTLVDIYRCWELQSCARQAARVPGAFMEVGVWRGGSAALLARAAPGKEIHLFDTFSGVVKAGDRDSLYRGGEHADTSLAVVHELFAELGLEAHIHVGMFPDDTGSELPDRIALAHIDVDTYGSALESFRAVWNRVSPGGMVIFDDYGFQVCEGVTRAVEEIAADLTDGLFVHNLNGHALLIKLGS
jgi:O-methyltransferase